MSSGSPIAAIERCFALPGKTARRVARLSEDKCRGGEPAAPGK
jgi:hypothetical protein